MPAKYLITTKGTLTALRLTEFGDDRPHDFHEAPTTDHPKGKDVVVQWVLKGEVGASMGLTFENDRSKVPIVKDSTITKGEGLHQSGAVFRVP